MQFDTAHAGQFPVKSTSRRSERFKVAVGSGYAARQSLLLQLSLLPDHWVISSQGPISRVAAARILPTDTKTSAMGPLGPVVGGALAAGETGAARHMPTQ